MKNAEKRISTLENAKYSLLFNSGMSAISAIFALAPAGKKIIVPSDFYSGVRHLLNKVLMDRLISVSVG